LAFVVSATHGHFKKIVLAKAMVKPSVLMRVTTILLKKGEVALGLNDLSQLLYPLPHHNLLVPLLLSGNLLLPEWVQ
jgi:hypothetical protein